MKYPIFKIKENIIDNLSVILEKLGYPIEVKLEIPPDEKIGDYAYPCFPIAKIVKKKPFDIAEKIKSNLPPINGIKSIEVKGAYINFFIDKTWLIGETIPLIVDMRDEYGSLEEKDEKVIVEHTSANPNGPLHVGRARNPIIGDTIARIFKKAGYKVETQFYLDDLGKQVAILAWGVDNLKPSDIGGIEVDKPDHRMVKFYQKTYELMQEDKRIEEEVEEIVRRNESGEEETIELVKKAYTPVLEGMRESLSILNIDIDRYIPESMFVKDGSVNKVIEKLKKYCLEDNGAYYLDLKPYGVQGRNTKFYITRSDGTSLYATRDIAYHIWKAKQGDILINILGEDHKLEAKQVEIGLKLLGEKHIPITIFYSFVSLPEGKMSTRRGRVVYLDNLIEECISRAYEEVKKRRGSELSEDKMHEISKIIGIGALRYNIIKVQPEKDMIFRWEEALNFEGNSAPFIQYAHARASSILSKYNEKKDVEDIQPDYTLLSHESEIKLVKNLAKLPVIIEEAYKNYKPHLIASYLFETASLFNQFYRDCPVLSEENPQLKKARLKLVESSRIVIRNGLNILGIIAPEEM